MEQVIADAKAAMAKGDPTLPQALDAARRWRARGIRSQFTGGDPAVAGKVRAIWGEALADPMAAPKLPLSPDVVRVHEPGDGEIERDGRIAAPSAMTKRRG